MLKLTGCLFAALLVSVSAFAADFQVQGVNGRLLLRKQIAQRGNLGLVTDRLLTTSYRARELSDYKGSEDGLLMVNGLGSAMEVLSNTRMNAYGWCYTVDGVQSDKLTGDYQLTGMEKSIVWFYAYAVYDTGKWKQMCVPATHEPSAEDRQ